MRELQPKQREREKQNQLCGEFLCKDCLMRRNCREYHKYMLKHHPEVFKGYTGANDHSS